MRVLILGAGLMGAVIAKDMVEQNEVESITLVDMDEEKLMKVIRQYPQKIQTAKVDVTDTAAAVQVMRGHDVIVSALPHKFSLPAIQAAIEAGVSLVDLVCCEPEKRLVLDEKAKKAGVAIVPGCGVAPGMSNILAGYGVSHLDSPDKIIVRVGGFPQNPKPPLGYTIVFCFDSVMEACREYATVIKNGKIDKLPPLAEVERFYFENIGELESFITDGLGTLPYTMIKQGVKYAVERTLRYPGYAERMKTLAECGLFDETPVDVKGYKIAPKDLTSAVLTPKIRVENDRDILAMRVTVTGQKDGTYVEKNYDLIDYYDEKQDISAMARTTAFPAAAVARYIATGVITEKGIIPPETGIGQNKKIFDMLIKELTAHNIKISL